jgi:Animal haem peroxidase
LGAAKSFAAAGTAVPIQPGRFGRIFSPSAYSPSPGAIHDLAESMREAGDMPNDNPNVPLGFTFFGQFIDHDLTLDATTAFGSTMDPAGVTDFRTPNLDLDCLYGPGPGAARHMYDVTPPDDANPVKLLLDAGRDFDLPRNSQNTAIIGDLRNDENFLVSQLHLALIKFHNAVVDHLRGQDSAAYEAINGNVKLFNDAAQCVRWHYQWIIVHEFLPKIVGQGMVDAVLKSGPIFYDWRKMGADYPFMPVEFSTAAYRLGHTMLRQDYTVNDAITKDLFDLPVFGNPRIQSVAEKLDFTRFYDFPGAPPAQRARKFDAKITMPVFDLPFIDRERDPPRSLAERNMLRGAIFSLPSGQEIAQQMKDHGVTLTVYDNAALGIEAAVSAGLQNQAPLFFYILKESELAASNSIHLGPVGGRLVAEVFIGLLSGVRGNYLHDQAAWTPQLPSAANGEFTMVDLLKFANA